MYSAIIAQLQNVRKHSNADRLQLATVYGNQIIIGLEQKEGDIGIYFPTDGQLDEKYCEVNNLIGKKNPETGEREGGLFDHKRRVRTQILRKEKSDGFWMPLSSLSYTGVDLLTLKVGDQLNEVNGIPLCKKYISRKTHASFDSKKTKKKYINKMRKNYGMLHQHFDTSQWSYNTHKIKQGDLVILTDKVHGTSARTGYIKVVMQLSKWKLFINKFFSIFKEKYQWEYVTGTRRVVLDDFNDPTKLGFYGSNEFRKQYHDKFIGNLKKGETVYYEIVGWVDEEKSIMNSCDNTKIKDKEFVKRYGETTTFSYNCPRGISDMYVYRITMTNEDGYVVEYPWFAMVERCEELGIKTVKLLQEPFIYGGNLPQFKEIIETVCDGPDPIDPSHIREGVVVRIENGLNLLCFKHKNIYFKIIEGIIKGDDASVDIEEQQDIT